MTTFNMKAVASAFAALMLTTVLSLTFLDATSVARVQRHATTGLVAAVHDVLAR